jgi:hypothetical protein
MRPEALREATRKKAQGRNHQAPHGFARKDKCVLPTSQREFQSSIAYRFPYMKEEGTP